MVLSAIAFTLLNRSRVEKGLEIYKSAPKSIPFFISPSLLFALIKMTFAWE